MLKLLQEVEVYVLRCSLLLCGRTLEQLHFPDFLQLRHCEVMLLQTTMSQEMALPIARAASGQLSSTL